MIEKCNFCTCCSYNGKENVWRQSHEKYLPECMKGTVKHDQKIMVWGCFCYDGVGMLSRIRGIMDAKKYHFILQHRMKRSASRLFEKDHKYIFQSDNDPKHTAKVNTGYLQRQGIPELDWPSQSPDLNPIENLWAILNIQLKDRKCKNKDELEHCLKEAWNDIDEEILKSLIESMPKRCKAVIDNKGFPIKY